MKVLHFLRCRTGLFRHHLMEFRDDRRGAVAYLTAVLSLVMIGLTGLAIDYGMAVVQKSKLDAAAQAAAAAGVNAARNLLQLNLTQNSQFDAQALAEGERVANEAFDGQLGATSRLAVSTKYVAIGRVGNTVSAQIDYEAQHTTLFSQVFGVTDMNLKGSGSIIMGLVDNPPSSRVIDEVWAEPAAPRTTTTIMDASYRDWRIQDGPPKLGPTDDPRAGNMAMLVGGGGNNSISKKVYLPAGVYELRYWYKSAVIYPEYQPAFICDGMNAANLNYWSSDRFREYSSSTIVSGSPQSARLGVFLHPVKSDPRLAISPPTAVDFQNRVETCLYAGYWIERSTSIEVTRAGYYWLSFVGDAPAGSQKKGGWIGRVKLCIASCGEPDVRNFPYATNDLLMEETFNSPIVANRTPFNMRTSPFKAAAKYEVLPSTAWESDSPVPSLVSNEAPLVSGQHLIFKDRQTFRRKMFLPPGRYFVEFSTRGNGGGQFCSMVRSERQPGPTDGMWICRTGNATSSWVTHKYCMNVISTNFAYVGGGMF